MRDILDKLFGESSKESPEDQPVSSDTREVSIIGVSTKKEDDRYRIKIKYITREDPLSERAFTVTPPVETVKENSITENKKRIKDSVAMDMYKVREEPSTFDRLVDELLGEKFIVNLEEVEKVLEEESEEKDSEEESEDKGGE